MKIKDMPTMEKPRERLLQYGVENLSNADLISIILRTGTKDNSVKDISHSILNQVDNLNDLSNIGIRELSNIKGMGSVKAITLMAAIELGKRVSSKEVHLKMKLNTVSTVHDVFKTQFINQKQEKLLAIYLDTKKCLISYKTIFVGTIDHSVCHPREIFNEGIKVGATSIIIMHNHPSGNLTPSSYDIEITNKLITSGYMLGIPIIDHIITNGEEYYSFYDDHTEIFQK